MRNTSLSFLSDRRLGRCVGSAMILQLSVASYTQQSPAPAGSRAPPLPPPVFSVLFMFSIVPFFHLFIFRIFHVCHFSTFFVLAFFSFCVFSPVVFILVISFVHFFFIHMSFFFFSSFSAFLSHRFSSFFFLCGAAFSPSPPCGLQRESVQFLLFPLSRFSGFPFFFFVCLFFFVSFILSTFFIKLCQ